MWKGCDLRERKKKIFACDKKNVRIENRNFKTNEILIHRISFEEFDKVNLFLCERDVRKKIENICSKNIRNQEIYTLKVTDNRKQLLF